MMLDLLTAWGALTHVKRDVLPARRMVVTACRVSVAAAYTERIGCPGRGCSRRGT